MGPPPIPPSLILFARAPRAGEVKTRLLPAVGPSGAARLYRAFLEDAARVYSGRGRWSAVLCAEARGSEELAGIFAGGWRIEAQSEGDLGDRLARAFRAEFARGAPAAVAVGSDHPSLPRDRLVEAFATLADESDAALVPAEDGGYCAIGLRAGTDVDTVFRDIPWSTPSVLAATFDRLRTARLRVRELASAYDVDRPQDLDRLRRDIGARRPDEEDYPRATAAALEALDRFEAAEPRPASLP